MNFVWSFAFFTLITIVRAEQEEKLMEAEKDYIFASDNFIEPERIQDDVGVEADQFQINNTEYLFVNERITFKIALQICRADFQGDLAFVKELPLAKILAEALSETNLVLDTLWIGARQDGANHWNWVRNNQTDEGVDPIIINKFLYNPKIKAHDRRCLSFSRTNHDVPQFRPLACWVRRAAMCERTGGGPDKNSTHSGWIKIGRRYYKIFQETVDWNHANMNCQYQNVSLAVVISHDHAHKLGRYLLVGRPSLENAWIGADWNGKQYVFEDEEIMLDNTTDNTGYPPWREKQMMKPGGCILLDRHLDNYTLFVETRCDRLRPYICYKIVDSDVDLMNFTDVIINDYGYRMHYYTMSWLQARDYCKVKYADYSAFLTEIRIVNQTSHLLYVMGENRTAVQHIWIGGKFEDPSWFWETDQNVISTGDDAILNWIRNSTYDPDVESINTCLVMDRENHIVALHYGTQCFYEHHFVCQFTADNLRKREAYEKKLLLNDDMH